MAGPHLYRLAIATALHEKFGEAPEEVMDLIMETITPMLAKDDEAIAGMIEQMKELARGREHLHSYEARAFKVLLDLYHDKPGSREAVEAFLEYEYPADWRKVAHTRNWKQPECLTEGVLGRWRRHWPVEP
ncbi:hypothetical protein CcrBL47_gp439 [Caulobacter phage BL47]|nr:hypothetical protein CcrBL47_gp439 [Caulobacter phage BL47]